MDTYTYTCVYTYHNSTYKGKFGRKRFSWMWIVLGGDTTETRDFQRVQMRSNEFTWSELLYLFVWKHFCMYMYVFRENICGCEIFTIMKTSVFLIQVQKSILWSFGMEALRNFSAASDRATGYYIQTSGVTCMDRSFSRQ